MIKYLLLLFIIGCTRNSMPLHSKMVIDSNFSPTEQELIITSISQWEKDTDDLIQVDLSIVDEPEEYGNDTGKILQSNDYVYMYNEDLYGFTNDSSNETTITIYTKTIYTRTFPISFQEIMLHEFGHALGLVHVGEGIMFPHPTGLNCLDSFTLSNFCAIHDCSNKNIKSDCL